MKTWCRKISRVVAVCSAFLFFAFSAFAQLTISSPIDPGPYTPGSSIAATFNIGSTCIKPGNVFNLYLVSSVGTETLIGSYNGFYTTFVNGTLPDVTIAPPGTGYKLRIKSTTPVFSVDSDPISIVSGTQINAQITNSQILGNNVNDNKPEVFGLCKGSTARPFSVTNASTINSVVTGTVKKETNTQSTAPLVFNPAQIATFNAELAHYTILIKASLNGTIATRAYFLINNNTSLSFKTTGNDIVCLPTKLTYGVTSEDLLTNFPGNIYTIEWGDGSSTSYTLCDIINNANVVDHLYEKSSCGSTFGGVNNAFGIKISAKNSFCPDIGTPVSTTAKVVVRPQNSFTFGNPGCTATNIVFRNISILGEDPTTSVCSQNKIQYTWSVDGDVKITDVDVNYNFVWNFTTKGTHTITLSSSNNSGGCSADPVTQTICIQDPPKPAFTLPSSVVCTQTAVKPKDESINDPICNASNTYTWSVLPAAGVTIDDIHSKEPNISFSTAGNYTVILNISTTSCGVFTATQPISVNTNPTATLSPDIKLCNLGTYDFKPTTTGPTKSTLTGTTAPTANTYTWSVTGGGSYTYENNTGPNSQYPSIKFNDYVEYTVSVTHTNNCGTPLPVSQKLTFITSPVVNAGTDQKMCFNTPNVQLTGSIDGLFTDNSSTWIGGGGQFLPDKNVLNPTYEPTAAERAAGSVNLILRKTTGLSGVCATVDDEIVITIDPAITITSAATKIICSGTAVNYTPTSNPAGATYSWSSTGTPNASGFTSGTGAINDVLTNTDLSADAIVTYTIIPRINNCDGASFKLIVTVKAKSVGGTTIVSNNDVCAGANSGSISLSGNIGSIIRWESSIDGGQTWVGINSTTSPYVFSNLTQTTQFRAVVKNSVCDEATSQPIIINVNPAIPDAIAGANQNLCGANSAILNGNKVDAPYIGKWTLTSTQTGVLIADPLLFNTSVTGLVPGETYKFKWTITGAATCDPKSSETTIIVYRPLTNTVSAAAPEVCSGQNTGITGDTPTGGNGTYTYQWQSSTDGNTWVDINGQTGKDLNIPVTTSSFYRRIVNSNVCTSNSNSVEIKVLPVVIGNTIAADQTICIGSPAPTITGTTPTGGSGTYLYQWQSSTNNGSTWVDINGAISKDFTPSALTVTTLYRRSVASGTCSDFSGPVKITVNPSAKAEITYTTDFGCPPFVLTPAIVKANAYPDRNSTYTWFADNVQIGTGINFPGYTITGENKAVVIKLVVTSSLGCAGAETSHTFSTQQDVKAAFTQSVTQGCGPLAVNFTNTSTSLTASNFKWDFGNGTTSNLAQPGPVTFQPDPTGKDITYKITLSAITPCGTTTQTSNVLVQGKPVSIFSPDKTTGCSPLLVNFSNTSPVSLGTTYTYDFNDGSPKVVTNDRSSVSHLFTTLAVRDYVITMTAENACGKNTSSYTLRVSPNDITPELVVNAGELTGCAPLTVNFYNNSKGASRFIYDFGDGTGIQLTNSAPETVPHIFTKPGKFTVTLYASNDCSNAQTTETITVLAQPTVEFTADKTAICDGGLVKFKNTSKNAIGYTWDFGDGTTSAEFEPEHIYKGAGKNYTVKLTSINLFGCTNTLVMTDYINIAPELKSIFTVLPGNELSIPNFTFSFKDASLNGAGSWEWTFGDGTSSTLQNPTHTYANVGDYTVTLKILNEIGCSAISSQAVRIIGVPGFLFVPNSFMPASQKNELQTFRAKGRGIDTWKMTVFNKWGQVLWETTKLGDGAPLEGWDGRYNGQEQPQGVYFWKIDVKFINGGEWKGMTYDSSPPKKTGNIYLIR